MTIIWFILIGIGAGLIVGALTRGVGFGLIGNVIVGVTGALSGGFLLDLFNLNVYGIIGHTGMAVFGAVSLLFLLFLFGSRTGNITLR